MEDGLSLARLEAKRFTVRAATETDLALWDGLVARCNGGTLHHELQFLAYHPAERISFHHLAVCENGEVVAIVPGALRTRERGRGYASPEGASVGGPLMLSTQLADALGICAAIVDHAILQHWTWIDFVLGPTAYQKVPSDIIEFALVTNGFRLASQDMSFVIGVDGSDDCFERLFRKKQAWGVRSARRRGVSTRSGGSELLEPFLGLFRETYERLGTHATHSEEELAWLLRRLPDRVGITLAEFAGEPIAGIFVFYLNDVSAQIPYICSTRLHSRENGTVAAFAYLLDQLGQRRIRSLDLGPSASPTRINANVVFFKEGMGAVAQARRRLSWEAPH